MARAIEEMQPGAAPAPREQWYVAAYSKEVGRAPLRRTIIDDPIVFFRDREGRPVALFDRCPHRGLRLSAGRVESDIVRCRYHGFAFDRDGACVLVPSGGRISPRMRVHAYPLVERWQWIWIWMGNPDDADPADIPDLAPFGFGVEGWFAETSVLLPVKANFLLPFENLLDATHVTFLHVGTVDSGDVAAGDFRVEQDGCRIRVTRTIREELQSPLTMKTFGFKGSRMNRTIIADAIVPNLCGVRVALSSPEDPEAGTKINQLLVGITPETSRTTLEFTAVAQTFPFVNPDREADVRNLLMEDVWAMEEIQALFDSLRPDQRVEYSVRADDGAMRARREFARMLERERMAEAQPVPDV